VALIVLIFGIWCLVAVFRFGTARAFLTVVLPVMMFAPCYFFLRLPHLPPLSIEDAIFGALGIGMLIYEVRRWRFTTLDLWIAVFICTAGYSERIPWGTNGAWLRFATAILECLVPYMAGKLLLERPGMRLKSIQTLVRFMTIACIFAIPQFFSKNNLYIYFWEHFFPGQWLPLQTRMGLGRVCGPYGVAEDAGMVILVGLLLAVWLQHGRQLLPLKYAKASILILALTLLMTQSRGPWIGAAIAFTIASIGRAAKPGRRAILIISLAIVVGIPLYAAFDNYISGKRAVYGSEQETAQYRKELIENYVPIAQAGGAWGWGNSFSHPDGQSSVDNEYLLIWLCQGYVGAISLILIVSETVLRYTRLALLARDMRERYLILTLLGIVLGLAFTLATVWMSNQDYLLVFLLAGWSQAILPPDSSVGHKMKLRDRVLVYT